MIIGQPPSPGLPPHILTMLKEGDELAGRIAMIDKMFRTPEFANSHPLDGQLLLAQHSAMQTYLRILSLRVARANDEHKGLIPPTASALQRRGPNRMDN